MDFGLITEGNTRHGAVTTQQRFREIVDAAVLADKWGFNVFGAGEQHFVEPLCTISAGEMVLAAISTATKNIRLRTTILVLPFHHPISVAERIASLDVLSGGRVEVGTGKGNNAIAAEAFGIALAEADIRWKESMEIMLCAWGNERFSYDGSIFRIPERRLAPNVLQRPHPPLWCAAVSPAAHEFVGKIGFGVLSLTVSVTLQQLEKRIAVYRKGIAEAEPIGKFVNDRVSVFCQLHCADTVELACEQAKGPMLEYMSEAVDLYAQITERQGKQVDFSKIRETISDFDHCNRSDMILVGDPDLIIKKIQRYEAIGVDEMLIRLDGIPHEDAMHSIELIGKHVIPEFRRKKAA